jgi:hypothetical protein
MFLCFSQLSSWLLIKSDKKKKKEALNKMEMVSNNSLIPINKKLFKIAILSTNSI